MIYVRVLTSRSSADFGVLLGGGVNQGGGDGNSGSTNANAFDDPTYLTIFVVSWSLIVLIVVVGTVVIVAYSVSTRVRTVLNGRKARESSSFLTKRQLRRHQKRDGSDSDDDVDVKVDDSMILV